MLSDKEIIKQVLSGSVESYSQLVQRWRKAACAVAVQVLHDHHLAEDAAQDAFVKAYEKLGTLQNPDRFGAWLMQIARNLALDSLRQKKRQAEQVSLSENIDVPDPSSNKLLTHEHTDLLNCVLKLPDHERQTIALKYFEGYSAKEVAHITGRPTGTITRQLSRAYVRLRESLAGGQNL
ncbi:MAG: sigma-70 family RNA polymerase sigma factor [Phycisphaeraceae bacterium]|nr:sigma-70 family RNA polymerase sigma factor [Phycisphaeraceae bacterium]